MNQHTGPRQKRIGNARKIKNAGKNLIVKGHLDVLGCKPAALDLWDTSGCVDLQCSFRVSLQSSISSPAGMPRVAHVSDVRSSGARMAKKWLRAANNVYFYIFRVGVWQLMRDVPHLVYERHQSQW